MDSVDVNTLLKLLESGLTVNKALDILFEKSEDYKDILFIATPNQVRSLMKISVMKIKEEISNEDVETKVMDEDPINDLDENNKAIEKFVTKLQNSKGWSKDEDIDDNYDVKGKLTIFNQKYDEVEAEIIKHIKEEVLICDEPLPIPTPDLTGLKPHTEKLDYDFEYDVFDYLTNISWNKKETERKTKDEDKENINTTRDIAMENAIQQSGVTDDYYSTNSKSRGLALLIVNNDLVKGNKYEIKISRITALLSDVLEFKIDRHDIQYRQKAENVLKEVNERKDADGDCLLIVILTTGHRSQSGREFIRFGKDTVETCDLWRCVDGNNCPNLANKPKIFIQIAWPELEEKSGKMSSDSASSKPFSQHEDSEPIVAFKIPNMSHFFIVSAIPQVGDKFDKQMVDCFLVEMIDVLRIHSSDLGWDLNKIMMEVNSRVCRSFYPNPNEIKQEINKYVRSPNFTSTLTKYFRFKPKSHS